MNPSRSQGGALNCNTKRGRQAARLVYSVAPRIKANSAMRITTPLNASCQ